MTDKKRLGSAIIFLVFSVAAIVTALMGLDGWIVFLCVVIEFCAFVWYAVSYIPYGRKCLTFCLKKTAEKATGA
jgi:hypothetical protein